MKVEVNFGWKCRLSLKTEPRAFLQFFSMLKRSITPRNFYWNSENRKKLEKTTTNSVIFKPLQPIKSERVQHNPILNPTFLFQLLRKSRESRVCPRNSKELITMPLEVEEHGIYPIGALEIYVVEFSLTTKYWINYCSCIRRYKLL